MAHRIDKAYSEAVASGLLPGISVIAGDKDGHVLYTKSLGKASLKTGRDDAFTPSTVCAIASMSNLMTGVAVLQCVELGKLSLDQDVGPLLPEMGKFGIIRGFDDETNSAILEPCETPITLRMLVSQTSGHEYNWFNPYLGKWRSSRNEEPWTGPTVADKSALPLVFTPGSGFAYGAGFDWAGKAVEVATGMTLDQFMREHIWVPLGIEAEVSFWPEAHPKMKDRMADISSLDDKGGPPAVDLPDFDILFGVKECLGGGGIFASQQGFYTFLSAIFRRDPKLMTPDSYTELFRPQLNQSTEQAFNDYIATSPAHEGFLGFRTPLSCRKSWSIAGMVLLDNEVGRSEKGVTMWGGVPSMMWFMDHEAGVCGTALCQILPPMHPAVMELHAEFQRGVFEMVKGH